MKQLYTIGETAKLLGVTTQTLRHYDRIGLLSPCHVDPATGYRYYRYKQFHLIDRIKYLQGFGMSLEDIGLIIRNGKNDHMLEQLRKKRDDVEMELHELQKRRENLDWYISYCSYMDSQDGAEPLYTVRHGARYIISCPCYHKEPLADMEIRLAQVKSIAACRGASFHRQYGYTLDIDSLFCGEFHPLTYFTYLSAKPRLKEGMYDILPAGEYLCLRVQLLHEDWDTELLGAYFSNKERPAFAAALEFEDNLIDWSDAWYELQILLP